MSPSSPSTLTITTHLTLLTLLTAATSYFFYKSRRLKLQSLNPNYTLSRKPKLIYISQTGTSKTLAHRLHTLLSSNNLFFDLLDAKDYEPEELHKESLVLFVVSTWEDGSPPSSGRFFGNWLSDSVSDFRVGNLLLSGVNFAVFGVGSKMYDQTFNVVGRDFSKGMRALGGTEVVGFCQGDVDGGELDEVFDKWSRNVVGVLKGGVEGNGGYVCDATDEEVVDEDDYDDEEEEEDGEVGIVDLEDIAGRGPSRNFVVEVKKVNGKVNGEKEMVTPVIRASLVKQGYKIIGSHSGVKLCRWTKSQLRGRGGCYKHSFYGIESHRECGKGQRG